MVRGELVHHSDAGSQYCAIRFTEHLQLQGITPSIGSVGDALDNALMESIIGLYKTECVRPGPFHAGPLKTFSDVELATMPWVDWYNHRRLHTTLGMRTPAEHEADYYAAPNRSRSPYEDGTKPVTVQYAGQRHGPNFGAHTSDRLPSTPTLAMVLKRAKRASIDRAARASWLQSCPPRRSRETPGRTVAGSQAAVAGTFSGLMGTGCSICGAWHGSSFERHRGG